MATLKDAVKNFVRGYRKTAVFALTTKCNCKCIMCDMHRKTPEYIPLNDAKKVLKFLANHEFLIAYFTGGEPTLHPNIVEIVDYAGKLGFVTTLTTNGSVSKSMLKRLKNAGLYVLSVSLDHWLETIKYSQSIGLKAYALAFLNPFLVHDGVDKLVDYTNNTLQVPLGFCYPTKSDVNSYGLGGQLSSEELSHGMDLSVKKLLTAKKNGSNIANLWVYMEDVINFREGNQPNFYCKGGEEVIYVDWHGDVYPCFLREKMFNILRDKPRFLKDVKCNDCLINCFREPSILPQLPSSPRLLTLEVLYSRSSRWIYG
jgi:MoaA/NifB/PqqE/SkfB family radical SAM enzyme